MRYQWKCEGESCEYMVEVERKFEDSHVPPEEDCEECGANKWRKLLNAGGIRWRFID